MILTRILLDTHSQLLWASAVLHIQKQIIHNVGMQNCWSVSIAGILSLATHLSTSAAQAFHSTDSLGAQDG